MQLPCKANNIVTGILVETTLVVTVSVVVCALLALALAMVIRRATFTSGTLPVTAEWINELSVERYRPMMRLLDADDLDFLRSQPGFNPRMARQLRLQRLQMFRAYLRSLTADFARVCAAIKVLMLTSRHDRSDLASLLLQHQVSFACAVLVVQFRLFLYRWGLCSVDVSNLIRTFDVTRLELRSLLPSPVPSAA